MGDIPLELASRKPVVNLSRLVLYNLLEIIWFCFYSRTYSLTVYFHGTELPTMCWCAVKKLLTHSLTRDWFAFADIDIHRYFLHIDIDIFTTALFGLLTLGKAEEMLNVNSVFRFRLWRLNNIVSITLRSLSLIFLTLNIGDIDIDKPILYYVATLPPLYYILR